MEQTLKTCYLSRASISPMWLARYPCSKHIICLIKWNHNSQELKKKTVSCIGVVGGLWLKRSAYTQTWEPNLGQKRQGPPTGEDNQLSPLGRSEKRKDGHPLAPRLGLISRPSLHHCILSILHIYSCVCHELRNSFSMRVSMLQGLKLTTRTYTMTPATCQLCDLG